jgi:hypothetical protein
VEFAVRDSKGDLVLAELIEDNSGTINLNTVMEEFSFQFATFGNLTTIQFSDTSPCTDSSDGFLDNVSIQLLTILGDVNLDGSVNLFDVPPFVERLVSGTFQAEADINVDGVVNLLDVAPFVALLSGG